MAVRGENLTTIKDIASLYTNEGNMQIATPLNFMAETNEILDDFIWVPSNDGTGHRTWAWAARPHGQLRDFHEGICGDKISAVEWTDRAAQLAGKVEMDEDVYNLQNSGAQYVSRYEQLQLETFGEDIAKEVFYGDLSADSRGILGFTARYNTRDRNIAPQAKNVLSAIPDADIDAASTNYASIWIVDWNDTGITMFYPEGLVGGFQRIDMGRVDIPDPEKGPNCTFPGIRIYYKWNFGLAVGDWRRAVRICNIPGDLNTQIMNYTGDWGGTPGRFLADQISVGLSLMPRSGVGRRAIYCNSSIATTLMLLRNRADNLFINVGEYYDRPAVTTFQGIPIRVVDALQPMEAPVLPPA